MNTHTLIQQVALVASIALPFFNIPLIYHIVKRKSSRDISMVWTLGVWGCLLFMVPSALITEEPVWKVFGIFNFIFFSAVTVAVLYFRKGRNP